MRFVVSKTVEYFCTFLDKDFKAGRGRWQVERVDEWGWLDVEGLSGR